MQKGKLERLGGNLSLPKITFPKGRKHPFLLLNVDEIKEIRSRQNPEEDVSVKTWEFESGYRTRKTIRSQENKPQTYFCRYFTKLKNHILFSDFIQSRHFLINLIASSG